MTLQEISEIVIEDVFVNLLSRIVEVNNPMGEPLYVLDLDDSKSFYERVILNSSMIKPSLALFDAELVEYKSELVVLENARLDELDRVSDITNRFNAIPDIRGAVSKSGFDILNPALELKRIVSEDDQSRLSALEIASVDFETEQSALSIVAAQAAMVDGLVDLVHGCIKIVMMHNISNALTAAQKDQQALDNSAVFDSLKEWRPGKFKSSVTALTPDGVLVTQDLKDDLLAFLTANGL